MASGKTFRPDDVGARQRFVHWAIAVLGLLALVVAGVPGLLGVYFVGLFLLHTRLDKTNGSHVMDQLLEARERALTREWNSFITENRRRAMSLAPRRPHRFLSTALLLVVLVLAAVFGLRVEDSTGAFAIGARLGIALVAALALWVSLFGPSLRTPLVLGADGVRVRKTFVAYGTITDVRRVRGGIVIQRTASLPEIEIGTTDDETAERLCASLHSERSRAKQRRAEPSEPLPAAGFRESSSQEGWRVRVADAASNEERRGVLARIAPDELAELLDETADPALESALHEEVARRGR